MFNLFGSHNELNLEPKDLKERLDRGDQLVLLDVREPWELKINRLEGHVHIPMAEIPERVNEIDPKSEVVVYCQGGVRSLRVALFLKKHGFEKVWNLAGGIDLWAVEVDPSMPRYR
jgi:rhodanese-related sulfurtransferase